MDRSTPEHNSSPSHKRLSVSFLVSMMVLCARHANRLSKKLKLKSKKRTCSGGEDGGERFRWNMISSSMSSPRPKELFTALSNKAMTMVRRKNPPEEKATAMEEEHGLWQREILMGGKCEPLDFSGVIYYDSNGRLLNEVPPRSPRGTPLPSYPTRS
ncbi:hypothetical protein AtNW77_Chr1g0047981 [Arabidopsis thaliana]|uniref:Transmembrane protein n=2 Tax=Arabidopsis TaxID=3701 RepID=A0A178W0W6_ARATH|nr:hypothetical protein ISN45_At01g040940 [Arabidopsis thaliana x Arabidopsis arenosa]OAP11908.1 hypothetical protein AXX17_AT1G43110 [Arabidopsis thaliana]